MLREIKIKYEGIPICFALSSPSNDCNHGMYYNYKRQSLYWSRAHMWHIADYDFCQEKLYRGSGKLYRVPDYNFCNMEMAEQGHATNSIFDSSESETIEQLIERQWIHFSIAIISKTKIHSILFKEYESLFFNKQFQVWS